jgi:hypothetical protein
MLRDARAYSGFSADDIPAVRVFYEAALGLEVSEHNGMLTLHLADPAGNILSVVQEQPA